MCGSVNVNDGAAAAAGSIEAPMGGMRDSGIGRRHGAEGIRKYTEAQTIATQRGMALAPPKQFLAGQVRGDDHQATQALPRVALPLRSQP